MKKNVILISQVLGVVFCCATCLRGAPVFFEGTGHYYDFIPGSFTWEAARSNATINYYLGVSGHLATITTFKEDEFIRTNFPVQVEMFVGPWLGGHWNGSGYGATNGWSWVTGETFAYTGWNGGEPNHISGESATHFSQNGWNDMWDYRTDGIGYFIEYEPEHTFIKAIERDCDDMRLSWIAFAGKTNFVQATSGTATGIDFNAFADISSPICGLGTGAFITNYLDVGAMTNATVRYYRIRVVP